MTTKDAPPTETAPPQDVEKDANNQEEETIVVDESELPVFLGLTKDEIFVTFSYYCRLIVYVVILLLLIELFYDVSQTTVSALKAIILFVILLAILAFLKVFIPSGYEFMRWFCTPGIVFLKSWTSLFFFVYLVQLPLDLSSVAPVQIISWLGQTIVGNFIILGTVAAIFTLAFWLISKQAAAAKNEIDQEFEQVKEQIKQQLEDEKRFTNASVTSSNLRPSTNNFRDTTTGGPRASRGNALRRRSNPRAGSFMMVRNSLAPENIRQSHALESRYLDHLLYQPSARASNLTRGSTVTMTKQQQQLQLLKQRSNTAAATFLSGMSAETAMQARLTMQLQQQHAARQSSLYQLPAGLQLNNQVRGSVSTFVTDEMATMSVMRSTLARRPLRVVPPSRTRTSTANNSSRTSGVTPPVPGSGGSKRTSQFQRTSQFHRSSHAPSEMDYDDTYDVDLEDPEAAYDPEDEDRHLDILASQQLYARNTMLGGAASYLEEERALRQSMGFFFNMFGSAPLTTVNTIQAHNNNNNTNRGSAVNMVALRSSQPTNTNSMSTTNNPMQQSQSLRFTEGSVLETIPSESDASDASSSRNNSTTRKLQDNTALNAATTAATLEVANNAVNDTTNNNAIVDVPVKTSLPFIPNMEQLWYFWATMALCSCLISFFISAETQKRPVSMTKLFQVSVCALLFISASTYRMQLIAPFPPYIQAMLQSPVIFTPLAIIFVLLSGEGGFSNWQETSHNFLVSDSKLWNMKHYGAGNFISILLNPAIVSLAFTTIEPIFEYGALMLYITPWLVMVCLTVYLICATLSFICQSPDSIALPLLVRTVTTPIALAISAITGGTPSLTAASVVINGVIALRVDSYILDFWKVTHPPTRGLAMGVTGTLLGVVALDERKENLAASVGMAGYAIATVIFAVLMAITPLEQFLAGYA